MTEQQALSTRICARLIGPIMLIIGAIVITRGDDLALIIPAILQDSPLAFVTGIFTLIVGMTLFTFHHHWTNVTAIIITLISVATIIRGIALMFAPSMLAGMVHAALTGPGPAVIIGGAIALLIGAWLTFAGWFAKT